MRRDHAAAVGATLTAFALLAGLAPHAASAATRQTKQADAALRYLYGQVGARGDVGGTAAGSMGAAEDAVISVADNGYDPATLRSSSGSTTYSFLSGKAATITTAGGAAKYILAWVAAGKPAAIDASTQLAKLNTSTSSGGYLTPAGTFHNPGAGESANTYSQSLAILAEVAAGHPLPIHATGWLICAQRPDGGFGYVISDAAAAPPASCGDTSSDTNDTAIALQATGAAGVPRVDGAAKRYLHSAQQSDGGFGFAGTGPTDPDSDATVIQALVALREDPTGATWTAAGGGNPVISLESFADPHGSGGYVQPGSAAPDTFTTVGVPQALALKPYAAVTAVTPGTAPPAPAPSPSPAPTPTTTSPGAAVPGVPAAGAGNDMNRGGVIALLLLAGGGSVLVALSNRRRPTLP